MRANTVLFATAMIVFSARAENAAIAVVTLPAVEAYARAVEGIRERIPNLVVLDATDEPRVAEAVRTRPVIVAVGSEGAAAVDRSAPSGALLLRSVVFNSDVETAARQAWVTITVELPAAVLLGELKRVFPGKTRLGAIRGPMQSEAWAAALDAAAKQHGFSLQVLSCANAREVVNVFLRFKGAVDMVWLPPNRPLYNSATLKPLLLASLTNRLPIIGFSEQFVEAGALFGAGPDFLDVGRQTGALALRMANREPVAAHHEARKFRFAYNERAARLVGIKAALSAADAVDITVIR